MAFLSPVTTVAVVRYNGPAIADKEATLASARLLRGTLLQHRARLRLRNEVTVPDSLLLQTRHEVYQAVLGIEERWQLASGANLPALDSLMSLQNQRYVLVTVASGFTRVPKQPQLTPFPPRRYTMVDQSKINQAKSNIFLFIYDSHQKAIVYYIHTPPLNDDEPLNVASVERQFAKLLKKDFRPPSKP